MVLRSGNGDSKSATGSPNTMKAGNLDIVHEVVGDDVQALRLSGRMSGESSRHVYKQVQALLEQEKTKILLNLSRVEYIDSEGIGMLVGATILVRERGSRLKLCALDETVKRILNTTNLNRALNLHATETEALESSWQYTGYRSFR